MKEVLIEPANAGEFRIMMPFEMCTCGHQRRDHSDHYVMGHGKCIYGLGMACSCNKFTWNGTWFRIKKRR